MYWIISGPDNNPLTGEVLFQQDTGFWAQAAPALSFSCSVCSILVAAYVAYRARQLTQQQRDIALDKLNLDAFDKRFSIFVSYQDFYDELVSKDYETAEKLTESFVLFNSSHRKKTFLFDRNDFYAFNGTWDALEEIYKFRIRNLTTTVEMYEDESLFSKLCDGFNIQYEKLVNSFILYTPNFMRNRLSVNTTTISRRSHPKFLPTGPKAILMRLKRAVYGWNQPLQ